MPRAENKPSAAPHGEAELDDFEGFAIFGVSANVYEDDSADGSCMCIIPGVFQIHGEVDSGTINPDDSATLTGSGDGIDLFFFGATFEDCAFEVTVWSGVPRLHVGSRRQGRCRPV